jgi:hypothetical protein
MDESTLRSQIDILSGQLSSLEGWMYFWTALVILGCAGELFFVIHAYLDERRIWFIAKLRVAVSLPDKPSFKELILEVLSVAVVVAGIAGELYIDWKSSDLQTQLRNANGNLVLLLEREAGSAASSAERANTAVDAAQTKVGALAQEADAVSHRTILLEKQANALDGKIRQAKAFADFALARTHPRAFRMDAKKFVDKLRGVAPCNVEIRYKPEDTEAYDLAEKIAQALGKGFDGTGKDGLGWNVTGPLPLTDKPRFWPNGTSDIPPSNFFAAGFSFGGGFAVTDPAAVGDPNGGATIWKLSAAMDAAGIHFMWVTQDVHLPPGTIRIIVLSQFD